MSPEEVRQKIREIDNAHHEAIEALEVHCLALGMELFHDRHDGFHDLKVNGVRIEGFWNL